ncbi:hypothetical protein [Candidatus Francisella endociliophora]|nr:hypothetical protein [Francisella sp. FSC1006]
MKKTNKFILIFSAMVLLSSCSTTKKAITKVEFAASNYPWIFSSVRKDLVQGNLDDAIKENAHIGNAKQLENLNELETARLLQLSNDFEGSIKNYNKALNSVAKNEGESLKQAKRIILDKNTYNYYDIRTAYNIPDYAISFLYTYQALNYLKTNSIKEAQKSLDNLEIAKIWADQQDIISDGMTYLARKSLKRNDIVSENLGLEDFKKLNKMLNFSDRIPNAYGNPMSYYLKSILDSAISKDYKKSMKDLEKAQKYTVGNSYLIQSQSEYQAAINSETSPFPMGMGRVVVFYEQGLVNIRRSAEANLDLGDIGLRKIKLPVYSTNYNFFDPKKITITAGSQEVVDTYTETLLDGTLFAMRSLIEAYSKIVTQNVVIEAFKQDIDKNFSLGGALGSTLKFDLSKTDPKRADLRSWLLLPNSVDLFEQQIDSGNYIIQVNNIRQNIEVKQGKTTLLWIVSIGKFNKVYYFII